MRSNRQDLPYKTLGNRLRGLRERQQKSLLEVSGAIEIEPNDLEQIEKGQVKPSEDLLLLLINYFKLSDNEADRLWGLANYEAQANHMEEIMSKQLAVIMPIDTRIIYTDMIQAAANKQGVVLNFMQQNGVNGQPAVASRVGMSYEHAKTLMDVLSKTLENTHPKALPAPNQKNQKHEQ